MVKNHLSKSFRSFTLIELVVVVAIMSILSLIWVLFLSNWLWHSKDSRKIQDLNVIKKSLDIYISTIWVDNYPKPDSSIQVLDDNNWVVWYQWVFWENATKNINSIQNKIVDTNWNYYDYSVTSDFKNYQVRTFLDKQNDYYSLVSTTKATNWINKTIGSFNWWLIVKSNERFVLRNVPSLFINNPLKVSWVDYIYLNDSNNYVYVPNSIVNMPINSIKSYDITDFVQNWDLKSISNSLKYFNVEDINISKLLNILKNSSWSFYVVNNSYFEIKTIFYRKDIEDLIESKDSWEYSLPDSLIIENDKENDSINFKKTIENWEINKKLILKNNNWILSSRFSMEIPTCFNSTEWDWVGCVIINCKWLLAKWFTNNWYYPLDIDGSGSLKPFNVYCDMDNWWVLYATDLNNLIWYWTFNNTYSDKSIHNRHWEALWNPKFTQWIVWAAIKLKWTDKLSSDYDWISIDKIRLENWASWTISAWLKIDSDSYWVEWTMSLLWSNSHYSVISSVKWTSNWYKDWYWNRYNWGNSLYNKSKNGWVHSVWSSSWNKFYSYINWEKVWEVLVSNNLLEINWIWVWYKTDNYISTWDWYIDDLVIFNRMLNSDEINNIYNLWIQWIGFWEK